VSTDTEVKLDLRNAFISMLFALVITTCASEGYKGFISPILSGTFKIEMFAILSHLILCVVVVTTSWIGWTGTFSRPDRPEIDGVFCRAHFLMFIDLLILGLYFSLIMSIDTVSNISTKPEIIILAAVFFFYFIWDISFSKEEEGIKNRLKSAKYTALFFAVLVFAFLHIDFTALNQWYFVVLADTLLLLVVVLFRAFVEPSIDQAESQMPEAVER